MSYAISLCICTYDRHDILEKAVESARDQTVAGAVEVLVVDNSPDYEAAATFGRRFEAVSNLRYIVERTPGLSNARNVAARHSRAPVAAFLDDDAIAYPDWAEEILRAFELMGPRTMIVGGKVEPIWSIPRPPWLHDSMLGNLSVVDWGGETRVAAAHEWAAGTNVAFRVEAILDHGGFPLNLGRNGSGAALLSNEEIELIGRIRADGGELIYAPRARVRHLVDERRLTKTWFRKRASWQALSDFLMNPAATSARAKTYWPGLIKYFNAMPPLERTVRGLMLETDDPDLFQWQTGAHYMLTMLMLAGFEGVDLD